MMKFPSGPHSFGRLSGHIYGEGNGSPLQYSCLENPMDGGAWWATVYGVAKSKKHPTSLIIAPGPLSEKLVNF